MRDILLVIDMQNDFIDGALGTAEAVSIVENVAAKVKNFAGTVIFTRDTHEKGYMETQEGRNLPVPHCIHGTHGWEICDALLPYAGGEVINKVTFGSSELGGILREMNAADPISGVTLVGLCTDICVISNAMIVKAFLPEVPVTVDASCCAGVTPESHRNALAAMKMCQIAIENE
jgi:nicotinamidase-related amidase